MYLPPGCFIKATSDRRLSRAETQRKQIFHPASSIACTAQTLLVPNLRSCDTFRETSSYSYAPPYIVKSVCFNLLCFPYLKVSRVFLHVFFPPHHAPSSHGGTSRWLGPFQVSRSFDIPTHPRSSPLLTSRSMHTRACHQKVIFAVFSSPLKFLPSMMNNLHSVDYGGNENVMSTSSYCSFTSQPSDATCADAMSPNDHTYVMSFTYSEK